MSKKPRLLFLGGLRPSTRPPEHKFVGCLPAASGAQGPGRTGMRPMGVAKESWVWAAKEHCVCVCVCHKETP